MIARAREEEKRVRAIVEVKVAARGPGFKRALKSKDRGTHSLGRSYAFGARSDARALPAPTTSASLSAKLFQSVGTSI